MPAICTARTHRLRPHRPRPQRAGVWARRISASVLWALLACLAGAPASTADELWPGLRLELVTSGLEAPYDLTHAGDGSGRLFIALADGRIRVVDANGLRDEPFLDIRDRVGCCGERALTSIAFSPSFRQDGHLFVLYGAASGGSHLSRFTVSQNAGASSDQVDPSSEQVLLHIPQPGPSHNANEIAFGADGYLYVALGDGGDQDDPCFLAQDPRQLHGKILRLDVSSLPYAVPPDNPLVDVPGARGEIWALGLRNPWRMSVDRRTGELLIGDAGEARFEELNVLAPGEAGVNFGWNLMEGEQCFTPQGLCEDGLPFEPGLACGDSALRTPVLSRCHAGVDGCAEPECAIIGGFRYRGHRAPGLRGVYLFSDWCHGDLWGARQVDGQWQSQRLLETDFSPLSFGEDEAGEIYLLVAEEGQVLRIQGLPEGFADDFESGTLDAWSASQGAQP